MAVEATPDLVSVRMLQNVGDWPKGQIVTLERPHARRLTITGYAVEEPCLKDY